MSEQSREQPPEITLTIDQLAWVAAAGLVFEAVGAGKLAEIAMAEQPPFDAVKPEARNEPRSVTVNSSSYTIIDLFGGLEQWRLIREYAAGVIAWVNDNDITDFDSSYTDDMMFALEELRRRLVSRIRLFESDQADYPILGR